MTRQIWNPRAIRALFFRELERLGLIETSLSSHLADLDNPHETDVGDALPDQSGHIGEFLTTDGMTAAWEEVSGGGGTDHGGLVGLDDDDHPQYTKKNGWDPNYKGSVSLAFSDGTRTFSITPTGVDFSYWCTGTKHTVSTSKSVIIDDLEGLWFITFNGATLTASQTVWDIYADDKALVAVLYWNASANASVGLGYELHSWQMDPTTHAKAHLTTGSVFGSGFAPGDLDIDGNGDDASSARLSVSSGMFFDEDIMHSFSDGFPQDMGPIARMPVLYRENASGDWRKEPASASPFFGADVSNLGYWNEWTGATWQLTRMSSNDYYLVHIFITNDVFEPLIAVMGQGDYATVSSARDGAEVEMGDLQFGALALMTPEFVPLATFIAQASNLFDFATNPSRVRFRETGSGEFVDWRGTSATGTGGAGVVDHGILAGLSDDDHPQYHNDVRGDARYSTNKTELDLVSDGAHDVKTNNPHGIHSGHVTGGAFAFPTATVRAYAFEDQTVFIKGRARLYLGDSNATAKTIFFYEASDAEFASLQHTAAGFEFSRLLNVVGSISVDGVDIATVYALAIHGHSAADITAGTFTGAGYGFSGPVNFTGGVQENGTALGSIYAQILHTIDSHSDTGATGAQLDELTGGGETALHGHPAGAHTQNASTIEAGTFDAGDFVFPSTVRANSNIYTDGSLRVNFAGISGDSLIYFHNGVSANGANLDFNISSLKFFLSHRLQITGELTTTDNIRAQNHLYLDKSLRINFSNTEPIGYLYFHDGVNSYGGFLSFDTATDEFVLNKKLNVTGDLAVTGVIVEAGTSLASKYAGITHSHPLSDIDTGSSTGDITFPSNSQTFYRFPQLLTVYGNEFYIDEEGNSNTSTINFHGADGYIFYHHSDGEINIGPASISLRVLGDAMVNGDKFYVGATNITADPTVFFGNSGLPELNSLKYDHAEQRFKLSDDTEVEGFSYATAHISDFIHLKKSALVDNCGGSNLSTTNIRWDVQDHYDIATFGHSTTKNQDQIILKAAGRYEIKSTVSVLQGGTSRTTFGMYVTVNGVADKACMSRNYSRGSGYGDTSMTICTEIEVASTNYPLRIQTYVDDTDSVYTSNTIAAECELIVRRIG